MTTSEATFKRNILLILGGSIAVLAIVGGLVLYNLRPKTNPVLKLQRFIATEGAGHVNPGTPLTFENYPPTSGKHYNTELGWGIYKEPQDEGFWIHSLEHGSIGILYNCPDGCPDLVKQLEDFYRNAPLNGCPEVRAFVIPYSTGMTNKVSLLAWQYRLDMDEFDVKLAREFFKMHEEHGPETIPCGASRMQ